MSMDPLYSAQIDRNEANLDYNVLASRDMRDTAKTIADELKPGAHD